MFAPGLSPASLSQCRSERPTVARIQRHARTDVGRVIGGVSARCTRLAPARRPPPSPQRHHETTRPLQLLVHHSGRHKSTLARSWSGRRWALPGAAKSKDVDGKKKTGRYRGGGRCPTRESMAASTWLRPAGRSGGSRASHTSGTGRSRGAGGSFTNSMATNTRS